MPQNTKPTFEEIYKALKNNKPANIEQALKTWIPQYTISELINTSKYDNFDLNSKSDTPFTVAAQLAMDGQHELVDELINKHGAELPSILMGNAMANQVEQVNKRINSSNHLDKSTLILAALEGYIISGNKQAVREFIVKYDAEIKSRLSRLYKMDTIHTLISAVCLNLQLELFESILRPYLLKELNEEDTKILNLTFSGNLIFSFANKKDQANTLLHLKKLEEDLRVMNNKQITDSRLTEEQFNKQINTVNLMYLAILDDKKLFQTFCKEKSISEKDILQEFGDNTFPYMQNLKKTEIYREYHIDAILNHYKEQRSSEKDAHGKIKSYHYFGLFQFFPNSFSFKQKEDAYNTLSLVLEEKKFTDDQGNPIDLLQHKAALRNGRLGDGLRAFIKAGRADKLLAELAGNEDEESNSENNADASKKEGSAQTPSKFTVRTVSEFVDALQAIIAEKAPSQENVAPPPQIG